MTFVFVILAFIGYGFLCLLLWIAVDLAGTREANRNYSRHAIGKKP